MWTQNIKMLVTSCILRRCEFVEKILKYRKMMVVVISSLSRVEFVLFPLEYPNFFVRKLQHDILNQYNEKHTDYLIWADCMFILEP
jgi:hypothetical protein